MQIGGIRITFEEKIAWNYYCDICLRVQRLRDTPREDPSDIVEIFFFYLSFFEFRQFPPFVSFTPVVFFLPTTFLTARSSQLWMRCGTLPLLLSSLGMLTWFIHGVVGRIANNFLLDFSHPVSLVLGKSSYFWNRWSSQYIFRDIIKYGTFRRLEFLQLIQVCWPPVLVLDFLVDHIHSWLVLCLHNNNTGHL